jgi:hypothetical protein
VALANSTKRDLTVKPVASKPSEDVFTVSNKDIFIDNILFFKIIGVGKGSNGILYPKLMTFIIKSLAKRTFFQNNYFFSKISFNIYKTLIRLFFIVFSKVKIILNFIICNWNFSLTEFSLCFSAVLCLWRCCCSYGDCFVGTGPRKVCSSLKHAHFVEKSITELLDKHCITEVTHPFIVNPLTVSVSDY